MSPTPYRPQASAQSPLQTSTHQLGVVPNFLHVPASRPYALESYIHLYLEGSALVEAGAGLNSRRRDS